MGTPRIKPNLTPTSELSYLIGVRFGDGNLNGSAHNYNFRLQVNDLDFVEEFNRCASTVLGKAKPYAVFQGEDGRYQVCINSKVLFNFLINEISHFKRVIQEHPDSFIRGFADSDGSVGYKDSKRLRIRLHNSDHELLKYIQRILKEEFGIYSTIRINNKAGSISKLGGREITTKKDNWTLAINRATHIARFASEIGFTITRKQIVLSKWLSNEFKAIKPYFEVGEVND